MEGFRKTRVNLAPFLNLSVWRKNAIPPIRHLKFTFPAKTTLKTNSNCHFFSHTPHFWVWKKFEKW
jgi:hypothetical protein